MSQSAQIAIVTVPANQNEKATRIVAYIREMLRELQKMTPDEAGPMLAYLIDMARAEAEEAGKRMEFAGV